VDSFFLVDTIILPRACKSISGNFSMIFTTLQSTFPKRLLNILVVLDKFYYHLKLLHLFLIHPVHLNTSDNVIVIIIKKILQYRPAHSKSCVNFLLRLPLLYRWPKICATSQLVPLTNARSLFIYFDYWKIF
jgi:hypothetical protein